jgi:hypothetical protein
MSLSPERFPAAGSPVNSTLLLARALRPAPDLRAAGCWRRSRVKPLVSRLRRLLHGASESCLSLRATSAQHVLQDLTDLRDGRPGTTPLNFARTPTKAELDAAEERTLRSYELRRQSTEMRQRLEDRAKRITRGRGSPVMSPPADPVSDLPVGPGTPAG